MGRTGGVEDVRVTSLYSKKKKNSLFSESKGMFNSNKHKMFR
jgi:hypothetical protein